MGITLQQPDYWLTRVVRSTIQSASSGSFTFGFQICVPSGPLRSEDLLVPNIWEPGGRLPEAGRRFKDLKHISIRSKSGGPIIALPPLDIPNVVHFQWGSVTDITSVSDDIIWCGFPYYFSVSHYTFMLICMGYVEPDGVYSATIAATACHSSRYDGWDSQTDPVTGKPHYEYAGSSYWWPYRPAGYPPTSSVGNCDFSLSSLRIALEHAASKAAAVWLRDAFPRFQYDVGGPLYEKAMPGKYSIPSTLKGFEESYINPYRSRFDWTKLASDAYGSNDFWDGNGIAYASDLAHFKRDVFSLAEQLSGVPKGLSKVPKYVSQLFLSFHYGWKLFAADTAELAKAMRQPAINTKRVQAAEEVETDFGSITFRYQVYYEEYGRIASELEKLAQRIDLLPDLSNLWDLVPYSFVVDWFLNISDILTGIDGYMDLIQVHDIIAVGKSITAEYPLDDDNQLVINFYERSYSKKLEQPSISLQGNLKLSPTHFVEAGALVCSRY